MNTKQYIKKLEPVISNIEIKNTGKYIVNDTSLPFLEKLGVIKEKAKTFEFINLQMLAWGFGIEKENEEYIRIKSKSKFRRVLSKIFKNKELEIEYKKQKCSLFKDLVVIYIFTTLIKAIIDNNFENVVDFDELKKETVFNKLFIGSDEEKKQIDEVFRKTVKADFNKAISFVKNNQLDDLVNLIKNYFECNRTKETFTKDDVKRLLNAFDFTK
jgi:hypothetical protein